MLYSELLSFVSEKADIYYWEKVFSLFDLKWAPVDNDEILLSHGSELEGYALRQLPWDGVFDEPGFMDVLTIFYEVAFGLVVWLLQVLKVEWKGIIITTDLLFGAILSFN